MVLERCRTKVQEAFCQFALTKSNKNEILPACAIIALVVLYKYYHANNARNTPSTSPPIEDRQDPILTSTILLSPLTFREPHVHSSTTQSTPTLFSCVHKIHPINNRTLNTSPMHSCNTRPTQLAKFPLHSWAANRLEDANDA